ncbi:MAG TPA: alpha-amylase family glycosyl hydrolase [Gemmatimonadaceae bacterium]|nr:alpha-amylase family glycosyl hydrolase [Gemmatimonadaceae bacterium]
MTSTGSARSIRANGLSAVWSACLAVACSTGGLTPAAAEPQPDVTAWWRNGVCYEVFVRSFADADGDGIGDLRGLISRLDYINDGNPASTASLGANCIWLMPISKAMSYHGYDVTDYYHVDPRYGSDEDFRNLVQEAHRRGIHVIVDFVPNHSGSENPWFQSALRDPASAYRNWYRWSSRKPSQLGPWGQQVWHKSPVRDEYYYGTFWHEMPDLNYQNASVRAEMQKVLTYWLKDMHADGFRFDAIPYLVEEGEQLQHSRGTHDVLRQLGSAARTAAPESFTIGEMSDESPEVMATYYPDQLDSYFAFAVARATMQAAATGDASAFFKAVAQANAKFPNARWSPFLTNHDQPRVMTVLGDAAKARVAASAMLMLPGMPFVYYGEEIGMIGPKPDEMIRTPMQWSSAPNSGFTTGKPWERLQADWKTKNVAAQDSSRQSLLNHYRKLIQVRNANPALNRGSLTLLQTMDSTGTIVTWLRSWHDDVFLIVVNFAARDSEAYMERLPSYSLPAVREYRLESAYADPVNACAGYMYLNGTHSLFVKKVKAHGFCALRIRRR